MAAADSPLLIRLNVLGPLEIIREPGDVRALPRSARAKILLTLFALKDSYERLELVRLLWPNDKSIYTDPASSVQSVKAIDNRLDVELRKAREAVGLKADSGFLYAHQRVVKRTRDEGVRVTSDHDDFMAFSDSGDGWSALELVRDQVVHGLTPPRDADGVWLDEARTQQKKDIKSVVGHLHPKVTDQELDDLCEDVLKRRYFEIQTRPLSTSTAPTAKIDTAAETTKVASTMNVETIAPAASNKQQVPPRSTRNRLVARGRLLLGMSAAVIICVGLGLWSILATSSKAGSIPPLGAIVNAWTGRWTLHQSHKLTVDGGPQIAGGPNFVACDTSAHVPCIYLRTTHPSPIVARVDDVIEFKQLLEDPDAEALPYVKLIVGWGPDENTHATNELAVSMSIEWPIAPEGEPMFPAGNGTPIKIRLPAPGAYQLEYLPDSTILTAPYEPKLLFHLPDGIMSTGIGLEDVGPPPHCFECAVEYSRIVSFKIRIT